MFEDKDKSLLLLIQLNNIIKTVVNTKLQMQEKTNKNEEGETHPKDQHFYI
jgi:hypothetical protein